MRALLTVTALAATAVFLAAVPMNASAQDAPSFAGSWTLSETSGAPQGGGGGGGFGGPPGGGMFSGLGPGATVSQDAETLTIVRSTPAGEIRSVYNLDGTESQNTRQMMGNQIDLVSRARWDGDRLVVTTPLNFGGGSAESQMTLSLDDSGNLVVETQVSGGPGDGTTIRSVYAEG